MIFIKLIEARKPRKRERREPDKGWILRQAKLRPDKVPIPR